MAHFINPFTDVGFKKIFGQEVSKDLLIDFLNDLLTDEKTIRDIHCTISRAPSPTKANVELTGSSR